MHWEKLGQLYAAKSVHPKLLTHAANPLAVLRDGDVYRVFYSGRDAHNRSSVGFADIDIARHEVVYLHEEPVFTHGPENSFYSHGISIGNVYEADGRRYMLFMGWQCPQGAHWRGDIGRFILDDDLSLRLADDRPFMSTDTTDRVSLSYPWVIRVGKGDYHMWYGSTMTWEAANGEMVHVIHHAASHDGHAWARNGLAIPYQLGIAQAFSRPSVIWNQRSGYQMWFSYRSGTGVKYRIGYATSPDAQTWSLKLAEAGIDVSPAGWDSEMIEYPFVFAHKGRYFMLYNGNGHGRTGFGLAVLDRFSNGC